VAETVEGVRLQKILADGGFGSRRRAEEAIAAGRVCVDGEVAHLGARISGENHQITVDGLPLNPPRKRRIVLALNKPMDYVCSHRDPQCADGRTIYALLPLHRHHRLICCGRLDKDSEGLLILTNDGQLANLLMHPSHGVRKFYRVAVDHPFTEEHRSQCLRGVREGGELLRLTAIKPMAPDRRLLDVCPAGGRKRHIRRMLSALGYRVLALQRYRIGNYPLGDLRPGHHRALSAGDLRKLIPDDTAGMPRQGQ
jgi:23S rRNA pseudouridine2605 synthase